MRVILIVFLRGYYIIIDPKLRNVLMFSSIVPSLIIFVPDYSSRQTKTRWVKTIGALFYSSVRFNFTIYHKPILKGDRIKCVFICVQLLCEKRKFFEGIITNLE